MAAKLEWFNGHLKLGGEYGWTLAELRHDADSGQWRYVLDRAADVPPWSERIEDAEQDCMAEVRRLLKEAGVEVE